MNEELMKKAYEDLDGVWPEGYTALIVSTYRNSVWGGGKYDNYSLGKDVFEQSRSNPLSWKWVGTKSEFEEYSKRLNGRATNEELIKKVYEHYNGVWPSRADVILTTSEGWTGSEDISGKFTEGWYDGGTVVHDMSRIVPDIGGECFEPWMDEKEAWIIACTEDQFKTYGDRLKKEWMPDVGERVEYTTTKYQSGKPSINVGEWYIGTIVAYHNGFVWTSDNGIRRLDITRFRPIKSDREKLIEECVNTLKNDPQCDKVNTHHMDAIEWLIDAGFINAPSS